MFVDEGVPPKLSAALARRGLKVIGFPPSWRGLKDGELLTKSRADGVSAFVTRDRNIVYQANLKAAQLGLVVLPMIKGKALVAIADEIAAACRTVAIGTVTFVDAPMPSPGGLAGTQKD